MIVSKTADKEYPYEVAFRYDPDVILRIKENIPYRERKYNPETRGWMFSERGMGTIKELFGGQIEYAEAFEAPDDANESACGGAGGALDWYWTNRAKRWFVAPNRPSTVQEALLSKERPDGYGLFFGVGCGKTASAVCEFFKRREEGRAHRMMVVVCIAGLRYNWSEDVKKLFGIDVDIIDCAMEKRAAQIRESEKMIAVTPYTTCGREDCVKAIAERFDMLVIDEIHLRVSDRRTVKRGGRMSEFGGISYLAKHITNRLALTGTVSPNKPTNCFSALHVIDPKKFPSKYSFEQRYCIYGGYAGKAIVGYKNMTELKQTLAYYGMFASKKDYLDIPRKTEEVRYVDISTNTERAIKSQLEIITQATEEFDILRLKDCYIRVHETFSCPSALWGFKSDKLKALKEVLEDVPDGEKVIIFTGFKTCVKEVMELLGDDCVAITGDMTDKSVERAKEAFKGEKKYLVATIQKMGAGFNLQHANHVVFMDTVATGAQVEQGLGRVHRTGQEKETHVVFIITRTPFEMNRLAMIEEQRELMDKIEDQKQEISPQIMRRLLGQILKPKKA